LPSDADLLIQDVSQSDQTHVETAQTHFGSSCASFGLVTDTTEPKMCLGSIKKDGQGKG